MRSESSYVPIPADESSVLLVEDDPDDEALTLRTFQRVNIGNRIVVARDGAEALDYVFGTGQHARRDTRVMPQVVLLDTRLPKVDGLEVLRRLRADPRTETLPVVILTCSDEEEEWIRSYELGVSSFVRKPINFGQFARAAAQLRLSWFLFR